MTANEHPASEGQRSPIKNLPVRVPGQSIDRQIGRLFDARVMPWFVAAGCTVFLAYMEWAHVWFKWGLSPWFWTVVAVVTVCLAVWRVRKVVPQARTLRMGQAKAGARDLCELVESTTGRKFFVQPVVLFPGWFVEKQPEGVDVWVLNDKVFPTFLQNAKSHLSPEDVNLVVFHLKRFVIAEIHTMGDCGGVVPSENDAQMVRMFGAQEGRMIR
jgi:hypothetical protein